MKLGTNISILPIETRVVWRNAMAAHVLDQILPKDNDLSMSKQEHVESMNLTIGVLLANGVKTPRDIVARIENYNHKRIEYNAGHK